MKHLTTSTDAQTILMIPRSYGSQGKLILRDESTNEETTEVVSLTKTGEYLSLEHSFSLIEGRFYDFRIEISNDIVYRDKIFCTDQDINQNVNDYYSVNEGEYTSESSFDNDYIII